MKIDAQSIVSGLKKNPVLTASLGLILVLGLWFYVRSDLSDEQQAELDKYTAAANLCRTNITNSAQLQAQVDFLVQANAEIAKRAFRPESMALNLQYFYKLESLVGIKYTDLRATGRTSAKGSARSPYLPLNYTVGVQGSFPQVISFMRHLEHGAYFCRINSASLTGYGSSASLTLDLDLLGIQ